MGIVTINIPSQLPALTGNSLLYLRVNLAENGIEWAATAGGGITIGTTAIASGTVNRILFEGAGNVLQQDSTFVWNNTDKRLILGTEAVADANTRLVITGSGSGSSTTTFGLKVHNSTGTNNALVVRDDGNIGIGALPANTVRLDLRAQSATASDIAFRVRNSADTLNMFDVNGRGEVNIKVGNQNLLYLNSTAGFSSAYVGQNFIVNTSVSGLGNNKANMVLINASDSTGTGTAGVIAINTASASATSVSIGSNVANSHRIQLGGVTSQIGFNLNCSTGSMVIGSNMNWLGGGSSIGMFVFGNNIVNLRSGFANAIVMGINQVDFVIGGGKGNIGVAYNPTGRAETNTVFIPNGTAPTTSVANLFQLYSADIVAGNAAPHFRTENGDIVKIYRVGGWGLPTGTFTRTTFDTATVTTEQLAERVAALIQDLRDNHQLLKA